MAATDFRDLTVNFSIEAKIKKPDMADTNTFYKIYSPITFKLKPREDIYLDLKFNTRNNQSLVKFATVIKRTRVINRRRLERT